MNEKKLLLVDDEKDTLLVLEKQLTLAGYTVVTANSGTKALSLAKSEQPNLIVLDVQMPDMDGGEVAHKLKEDSVTKNIPVVYLTCLLSEYENYKYDGNIMLAKSKDTKELIAVIDKYLSLNRQLLVETVDTAKSQVDKLTDLCLSETSQKYDIEEMPCDKISEDIINWDHLIALLGDEELINKIVPLFLKDTKECLDNLSDAIKSGDTKGIDFYGHTIKSAALTVGARRLSDIAGLLEYAGRGNNLKLALPLFDKLKAELEKTITFLSRKDWIEIAKQGKATTGERFNDDVI